MATPHTEAQKAMAVEILRRNNNVLDARTLAAIREALSLPKLPKQTVYRWLQQARDFESRAPVTREKTAWSKPAPIGGEAQSQAAETLDNIFESAARKFVTHATKDNVVNEMSGKDAMTAAGIAIDKMRILRGLPTEFVQILPAFIQAAEALRANPTRFLEDIVQEMRSQTHGERIH